MERATTVAYCVVADFKQCNIYNTGNINATHN